MRRVDLQFFAEEKTEKATPKKRRDSRKKGQVAKSADIVSALTLLAVFIVFLFSVPWMGEGLAAMMRSTLENGLNQPLSEGEVQRLLTSLVFDVGKLVAPVLGVAFVAAVFANVVQIGFVFSGDPLAFKPERLNPIAGFKRIYSVRAFVELLKSLLKVACVGFIAFLIIWMHLDELIGLSRMTIGQALVFIGKLTLWMGFAASVTLLFLGLLDYLYQKYDYEKNLRMSKQEVKDEYKKTEGDPLIKSKIRERQRQMAMRRMMQEVPKADVVITNPTHFAVALLYKDGEMDAPVVVAKGADYIAQKIKEVAKANGVTIVERPPLARALYRELDIGDQIPETFFKAVAEILAYVYQLKGKTL
ncbi:flagellar biosynthesis protein FlhB [Caenibacillus caldisaponilyticus]|uniref:flagellar biosynthesis protein FlhB n=1 Tax=Caenibacillus caldisaponilyticus TaxID=1674942 RepID=UPI0009885B0C|nr:flagellar biosynthesis protein FlhB [Caenibacillus caldisaponilyticus]